MDPNPLAALPRTDHLLDVATDLVSVHGRASAKVALVEATGEVREALRRGTGTETTAILEKAILERATQLLERWRTAGPVRVINAAGVVVHTNLGRAPLSQEAIDAVVAAAGYCDLEFDLDTGGRGSRGSHVDGLLAQATGAEDALVVNNCAAALVLALSVLAPERQVPVSRGHLIEIGGSFRLPDIMAASGAVLLEVGTTNRTRASDYHRGEDVAALLTLHPSNFSQSGFVTQPTLAEVAAVARDRGVPLIHDAGSGLLRRPEEGPLVEEVGMVDALEAGADLVLASGDKLLGGPQAGLIVGRADLVDRLRRAPLARAMRVDKLRLAALNASLRTHLRGGLSPVEQMLAPQPDLADRAARLAAALDGEVVEEVTMIGGGSAPGVGVVSPVVALGEDHRTAAALRAHTPPVIVRVQQGQVLIDLRTVDPGDDEVIITAVRQVSGLHHLPDRRTHAG